MKISKDKKGLGEMAPIFWNGYEAGMCETLTAVIKMLKFRDFTDLDSMHEENPAARSFIEELCISVNARSIAEGMRKDRSNEEES